jgi:hypothetical protein
MINQLAEIPTGPGKRMLVQLREFKGQRFLTAFLLKQHDGTWQAGPFFTLNKHSFQPFLDTLNGNQEIITLALHAKSAEELEQEVRGDLPKPKPAPRTRTAGQASQNQLELDFGEAKEPEANKET